MNTSPPTRKPGAAQDDGAEKRSPAAKSLERERRSQKERQDALDEGLEETFPASDPASATNSSKPGNPKDRKD